MIEIAPMSDVTRQWLEFCSKYIFGFDEFQYSRVCMASLDAARCLNKHKEKVATPGKRFKKGEVLLALTNLTKSMTNDRAKIIDQ